MSWTLDRFLIGGAVSNAGNLRQWALRELRLNDTPSHESPYLFSNRSG